MIWATRAGVHIDRAACAWLIRRWIDGDATFCFVAEGDDAPTDAICFDMPMARFGHRNGECSFETMLRDYDLIDPVLWLIANAVHEADLCDERLDAPEAAGLDMVVRGLSLLSNDDHTLAVTANIFDALYEYHRQAIMLGREPA